jgi:hypothetical protein
MKPSIAACAQTSRPLATPRRREPALAPREPAHDRAAARARRAGAERAGDEQPDEQRRETVGEGQPHQRHGGGEQAARQHGTLADAVREHPPRDGREHHPDRQRGEREPDLAQGQAEHVAELRAQRGEAHPQTGERRGAERPDREHDPAVARSHVDPCRRHRSESNAP